VKRNKKEGKEKDQRSGTEQNTKKNIEKGNRNRNET
jgi:hypothetical protein